jgi:hypothetical protein
MKLHPIDEEYLPLRADLRMVGARCDLSTNSEEILSSLSRWEASPTAERRYSFELNVMVDSEAKHDRSATPHFRGLHHLVFGSFGATESFVFDLLRRKVSGVVSEDTAGDERFWNTRLLPTAIGLLGATIGVVPLHCACLDKDGEGLLLAGDSGTGKSTLAVALSRCGFGIVSDGWTYVGKSGNDLTAYGISAPVKLLPDAAQHFPELCGFEAARASNGEMAFEVDAAQAFGADVRSESRPRWLVFLERVEAHGCEIVPFTGEAAQTFFENNVERLPDQLKEAAKTRAALIQTLSGTDCWLARYGGPPHLAAEALSRFCERM